MPNIAWTKNSLMALTLIGVCDGVQIVNVHHFESTAANEGTLGDDLAAITWSGLVADDWITSAKAAYLAMHTTDYLLTQVKAQVLERPGSFRHKLTPVERPQTTGNAGTAISASNVNTTAVVLKWRTPQAGKHTRGRSYIGPIAASHALNGQLDPAAAGGLPYQAYVTVMQNRYFATGTPLYQAARMTIYSRPYNEGEYQYATRKTGTLTVVTPEDYGGNSTLVTAGSVDPILRVQRRRELGVGS